MPNYVLLDTGRPKIAHLLTAMLQAREAVGRRSWSHPQEPTGEDWWADVLADPRARKRNWRTDKAVRQDSYRLSDELHPVILVACSKCDWRAAFSRARADCFPWGNVRDAKSAERSNEARMYQAGKSVGSLRRLYVEPTGGAADEARIGPRITSSRCGRKCGSFE